MSQGSLKNGQIVPCCSGRGVWALWGELVKGGGNASAEGLCIG